ncbi:hypothetical protein HZA39_00980 [Candidatus Peregrinibacteria bacterium]|nr:hypothetical protein [Candidatus Peregrinibacteria bacterium]
MAEDKNEHIEFGESRETSNVSSYVKDFFDVDKVADELPDLKLKEIPAYNQAKEIFGTFSEILNELATRIDIKNTNFTLLNNADFKKVFYNKLTFIFSEKIEPRLAEAKKYIDYFDLKKQFPEGWEDRTRYFAAWPFLIHFGEARKGEKDYNPETGEETDIFLDYIRHPARVSGEFNKTVGLLDEPTLELASCHDIKENFPRGIFTLLQIPEKDIEAILPQILSTMDNHQSSILQEANVPFSDLVNVMSKKRAEGILRPRHTLNLFLDLTNLLHNPEIFMQYLRCILVKMPDRLDNSKTSIYLKEKDPTSFSRMMEETLYNFIPLADVLGMTNVDDWLKDFYELIDRRTWKPFFDFRKELLMKFDFQEEFKAAISKAITAKAPAENFTCGKDYIIELRPRALRYRQKEVIRQRLPKESAEELSTGDIMKLSQPFLNYVVFIPLIKDEARRQKLVQTAQDVFKEKFPNEISALYRFDKNTSLGRMFNFTSDIAYGGKGGGENKQIKFGAVVYKIFDSLQTMRKEFYGLIHAAFIDKDEDAKNKIIELFNNIKPYVDNLASQLELLDKIKNLVSQRTDATKKKVEKTINSKTISPIDQINEILQDSDADILRYLTEVVERKILALFAETIKINFTVVFGGEEINLGQLDLPKGADVSCALLHLFPTLLLSKNQYEINKVKTSSRLVLRRQFEDNDSLKVYVGEPADVNTQKQQIQKASKSLRENVLSEIAFKYIGYRPKPHHVNHNNL